MALRTLLLYLIVPLVFVSITVKCSKLNVPRVLLPIFNDFATNFTLEATEGGCYKWSTTRYDIIQITALDEDPELECSTRALVSTVTKEAARNMAVVLAEDTNTKQMLRCDVMVDAIHELRITTTTRELFMEEAPEDFEVNAYDDQGNEFSSLEGIEFDWNIVSLGPNREAVLRYIAFRDSPYETPPGIEALEKESKKGYSILLEGVKSGSAKVSVRLPYTEYKHIPVCEVQLMVVANLLITPPEAYIMKGDTIPFKIFFLKNGRMEEVELPDSQYYLEAENQQIAFSTKKTGDIIGLKEGVTRIVLRDRNVNKDDPLLKLPAANLHVVEPDYLVLNILPHKNWAILVADHHDIVAELYTVDDHKIFIGNFVKIEMEVTPEFVVVEKSLNGSWLTGYGVKPCVAVVQASLDSVKSEKIGKVSFNKPINARNDILIFPRISIIPSEVILPWDPVTRPKYEISLTAKGGDGKFMWISTDNSLGMVSQSGHVRTQSNGFFEVAAVMLRNHHNRANAKFLILPPSRLEIVEFVMEAEIGSPVYLHIALYAEQEKDGRIIHLPFSRCQELPFQIKMSDAKFRANKTATLPTVGISCGNIAMTALEIGTSKVTITYYQDGKALEDSVTLSAFKALTLVEPCNEVVLAVGTSINLVYAGGPRPMIGRAADFQRIVVSEDETIAVAIDVTDRYKPPREDTTVVEVLCRKIGETDVKLMISNTPTASNCKSQTHSVRTRINCAKPRKIVLQPELKIADSNACPMDLGSGNVVVQSTRNIDIDVSVFDESGLKFLNISSLNLGWTVEPYNSADVQVNNGAIPKNLTFGDIPISFRWYQALEPSLDRGQVVVNVTAIGYKKEVLKPYKITAESPAFITDEDHGVVVPPIFFSLSLYLVEDAVISPNILTVFNHPGNKITVPVKQGSGFFELAVSADDVAVVKYLESSKEIEITPLKSGEMTVQVIDLCLVSRPAHLIVNVVSVGIIRVEMVDKVEIAKCISVIVRLYDENDNLMNIPDPNMIDLRPEFRDNIANIYLAEENPLEPWGFGEVHYVITGVELGDTKLVFSVTGSEEEVHSAPLDLQVFEPLKLSPKNGSLIINSKMQIFSKGGPTPDVNIVFHTESKIIKVTEKGVIIGKSLGVARIYGRSIGVHPFSGQSIIYAEDYVEIQVVKLTGIKVVAPLTRFKVGAIVPFWAWGVPNISPMVLGAFDDPPIIFKWNVDDKLLVDLSGVFHPVGVFKKKLDRVGAKVTGLQVGKTKLFVNATVPGATCNIMNLETITLSSWIEIEIIPEFLLTKPKNLPANPLLIAPFSQLQLETNMEGSTTTKITYLLPGEHTISTDVLANPFATGDVIVSISPTGLLQSYGVLGQTLLIVTAMDELGLKQRLTMVVEVRAIQYMNLIVTANWHIHSDSQLRTVPLGTEFMIRATFHDNVGNKFHAGPKELKIRTSRCDLLKIVESKEDASVIVYTKHSGSTMVKGWAEGIQQTADYMKIHVEQSVRPNLDSLTSGDVICLWTPVVNEYNVPGTWKSSDDSLLHINPALDIGFVGNKEGVVVVTHSLLKSAPIYIQVHIVSEIEFLESPNIMLTNGEIHSVVRVVLVLQNENTVGIKTNNLIQGWRCRSDIRKIVRPTGFKCFIDFSNTSVPITIDRLFNITPSWVPDTGQYACKLINLGVNGTDISVLRTNVLLWATTDDGQTTSKNVTLKFLPGVYTVTEIILENSYVGEFVVIGLPEVLKQLDVSPADSSILYVDSGSSVNETATKYEIQLIDYHWRLANLEEAMGIVIISPITKQEIKILVRVSGQLEKNVCVPGRSPVVSFLKTYKYALATAAVMLLIFFLTFYFYSNYMQPVVNVNLNSTRSMLTNSLQTSPVSCQTQAQCAALRASMPTHQCNFCANRRISPDVSRFYPRTTGHPNTSRSPCTANCNREPIYGDVSTFYTSPEVRTNRRMM
ncbi:nuclear pore membrane glycoprotein 210 [Diorhabda carinulata]|uniref:nuclear pore membrane glycoprotein 210 n=1 Tax=Diorhabda carinulata TaxID=1163345 RepID=UPI0025A0E4EC|nr:nuclear pore membrane glycoprotein 210 [Diorhabda carinulata]